MYEVELKVRADHEVIRDRLDALGATFGGRVGQEDTYYDAPHREFGATDEALRVRRETALEEPTDEADDRQRPADTTVLTYKGPLVDAESKTRREAETAVGDPDALREILDRLGFSPAASVSKERTRYASDEWTITLDRVEELGAFVELETEAEEDDFEQARDRAHNYLCELGLDPGERVRTSYLELLEADGA